MPRPLFRLSAKSLIAAAIACLSASAVLAQSDLRERVHRFEVEAAHLLSQSQAFQATVSQATANLPKTKDGSVDSLQWIDIRDLNRKTAATIYIAAEDLRKEAAATLMEGRSSTPGFFSIQQGEAVSLGTRIFAVVQVVDCVEFVTHVVSENQSLPEAAAFAKTVSDGCKKFVAALRGEAPSSRR